MEIREKLEETISTSLENVSGFEAGSKEREKELEAIDTLYKLKLEEDKLEAEKKKAEEQGRIEAAKLEADKKKARDQKIFNWVSIGAQGVSTAAMIIAYNVWLNKGYRFEETGTIRSPHLRNLVGRILPKLK